MARRSLDDVSVSPRPSYAYRAMVGASSSMNRNFDEFRRDKLCRGNLERGFTWVLLAAFVQRIGGCNVCTMNTIAPSTPADTATESATYVDVLVGKNQFIEPIESTTLSIYC